MENKYSEKSEAKLATCHPDLQKVFRAVLEFYDHTILEGHRGEVDQNAAFLSGKSQKKWPDGEHNKLPSEAVDASPYPVDFSNKPGNIARFYHFAGFVIATGKPMGIDIRWGGDWDSDHDFSDQRFNDLVHFELAKK